MQDEIEVIDTVAEGVAADMSENKTKAPLNSGQNLLAQRSITAAIILIFIADAASFAGLFPHTAPAKQPEAKPVKQLGFNTAQGQIVTMPNSDYSLLVMPPLSAPMPNAPATVAYMVLDKNLQAVKQFDTVREKMMHLIVVRHDLVDFQHLQPVLDAESGIFSFDLTVKKSGPYHFFAEFTPKGGKEQLVDFEFAIGPDYKPEVFVINERPQKVGAYEASYLLPVKILSGQEIEYSIVVKKNGKAVTDFEQYLGALGQSTIIDADTMAFMRVHQTDPKKLVFHVTFPKEGRYKIMTEFQREGKVLVAERSLVVKKGKNIQKIPTTPTRMPAKK